MNPIALRFIVSAMLVIGYIAGRRERPVSVIIFALIGVWLSFFFL